MQNTHDLIGLVSDKIGAIAQSDVVIGDPIELGEITIMTLSRVSIGFGGGGGKVRPVGVIIFGPDGVEVQPIADKKGLLDKLFDKVPELVSKIHAIFDGDDEPVADATPA
jgi:uncharacterized spore protein YtfJ